MGYFNQMQQKVDAMTTASSGKNDALLFNMCAQKNQGTVTLRPITDELGKPYRIISYGYELFESTPVYNPDGTPKVTQEGKPWVDYTNTVIPTADPTKSNFVSNLLKLSPEQMGIMNKLVDVLRNYESLLKSGVIKQDQTPTKLGVKFRSQVILFWAKILSATDLQGKSIITEPTVKLCKHISTGFLSTWTNAMRMRTDAMRDNGAWTAKFMGHTPGTFTGVMSVNTVLNPPGGVKGYSNNVQFMDVAPFDITEADIAKCTDLYAQMADVTTFNADYYVSLTNRIQSYIDDAMEAQKQTYGVSTLQTPPYTSLEQPKTTTTNTINVGYASQYQNTSTTQSAQPVQQQQQSQSMPLGSEVPPWEQSTTFTPQQPIQAQQTSFTPGFQMPTSNT